MLVLVLVPVPVPVAVLELLAGGPVTFRLLVPDVDELNAAEVDSDATDASEEMLLAVDSVPDPATFELIAGPGFVTTNQLPATTLLTRFACANTAEALNPERFAAAFLSAFSSAVVAADVSTRIWVYRWLSGTRAGGLGAMYDA